MTDQEFTELQLSALPIAVISLPFQERRRRLVSDKMKALGLDFEFVDGVRDSPRYLGCSKAHLKAIWQMKGREPFLILEDDVAPTEYFTQNIRFPQDAGLVYLGHSPFGYSPSTGLGGNGFTLVEDTKLGVFKVHSMLAAHAILYVNRETTEAVEDSIIGSISRDNPRRHDLGLCEIQKNHIVYASEEPYFVQVPEAQKRKKVQRKKESHYIAKPTNFGDIRTLKFKGTSVTAQVVRPSGGGMEWAELTDEKCESIFSTKLNQIYAGSESLSRGPDLQGWNSKHVLFQQVFEATKPKTIIEVGVWKGASVVHMGNVGRSLGLDFKILAIDTWLGSPEHWLSEELREQLKLRFGYPTLYETFLANIREAGLENIVEPLPVPSETAAFILQEKAVKADVIHIDAGHEYESVYRDLQQYYPLLNEGGVIIGDHYGGSFRGVKRAFNKFCRKNELRLKKVGRKCVCAAPEVFHGALGYPDTVKAREWP